MKKIESVLYALILIIALIVILAKILLWSWAGGLLIATFTSFAFVYVGLSWLIFTIKNEQGKNVYIIYATIPLGLSIALLLFSTIAKLQDWNWDKGSFRATITMLIITEIILVTTFTLTKNNIRKKLTKELMIKTAIFILITFLIIFIDFNKLISTLSTDEANLQREKWRIEHEKTDSLFQNQKNI